MGKTAFRVTEKAGQGRLTWVCPVTKYVTLGTSLSLSVLLLPHPLKGDANLKVS